MGGRRGVEAAGPAQRAELAARLGDPALDQAGVARLREIITGSGALGRTEERIAALTAAALAALDGVALEPEAREVLTGLARAATARHC